MLIPLSEEEKRMIMNAIPGYMDEYGLFLSDEEKEKYLALFYKLNSYSEKPSETRIQKEKVKENHKDVEVYHPSPSPFNKK